MGSPEDFLPLLHDHYKESFSLIRQAEQRRDRLLLWLFLIYAALILEIQFPANARGAFRTVTILGNSVDLAPVPLSLLLAATWVVVAASVLKYCQLTKSVERQYSYLHRLEDRVSVALGDDELYRREGRAYLREYPVLLKWATVYYTILFPLALFVGTVYLYAVELSLHYGGPSQLFDALFAVSVLVSVILYRVLPRPKRRETRTYLDQVGSLIARELDGEARSATSPALLRLYAVVLLAKGRNVTSEDVHNAWSAWMQEQEPDHHSIKPFAELEPGVKKMDDRFVEAIKRSAQRLK